MAIEIGRDDVQRQARQGARLVEVLPREEYEREHIAGAVNIPLKHLTQEADRLGRDRALIVYCHDQL